MFDVNQLEFPNEEFSTPSGSLQNGVIKNGMSDARKLLLKLNGYRMWRGRLSLVEENQDKQKQLELCLAAEKDLEAQASMMGIKMKINPSSGLYVQTNINSNINISSATVLQNIIDHVSLFFDHLIMIEEKKEIEAEKLYKEANLKHSEAILEGKKYASNDVEDKLKFLNESRSSLLTLRKTKVNLIDSLQKIVNK